MAPDKAAYVVGEPVRLTGTLRNRSSRACGITTFGIKFSVTDGAGRSLGADRSISSTADCVQPADCAWPAGAVETSQRCWDQQQRAGTAASRVPPGTYLVELMWVGQATAPISATARVDVVAAPPGTPPPPAATC